MSQNYLNQKILQSQMWANIVGNYHLSPHTLLWVTISIHPPEARNIVTWKGKFKSVTLNLFFNAFNFCKIFRSKAISTYHLSIYLFVYLPIMPSIHQSIHIYLSFYLSLGKKVGRQCVSWNALFPYPPSLISINLSDHPKPISTIPPSAIRPSAHPMVVWSSQSVSPFWFL